MSIVKRNDNWGYGSDYSKSNWTGRTPRQSRITGEWSRNKPADDRIPKKAYISAVLAVLAFWLANFVG